MQVSAVPKFGLDSWGHVEKNSILSFKCTDERFYDYSSFAGERARYITVVDLRYCSEPQYVLSRLLQTIPNIQKVMIRCFDYKVFLHHRTLEQLCEREEVELPDPFWKINVDGSIPRGDEYIDYIKSLSLEVRQHVTLSGFSLHDRWNHHLMLGFETNHLEALVALCPNLKELRMKVPVDDFSSVLNLTFLKQIHVYCPWFVTLKKPFPNFINHAHLEEVHLSDCKNLGSPLQFENCQKLRRVFIYSSALPSIRFVNCPNLIEVSVHGDDNIMINGEGFFYSEDRAIHIIFNNGKWCDRW